MSQTETELFNLAAQAIGSRGKLVTTVGNSRVLETLQLWYPIVRRHVLTAAHWGSCKQAVRLTLASERAADGSTWAADDPFPGWKYAYHLPTDKYLYPRYLTSGARFELARVDGQICLNTDEQSPVLIYTYDNDNPADFESELYLAVAMGLAAFCAQPLTGRAQLAQSVIAQANAIISNARASSANQSHKPVDTVASWHAARGYMGVQSQLRYIYPYAPLLTLGAAVNVK